MDALYTLKPGAIWAQFKREHFSFWMICCFMFMEYVSPQVIVRSIDVLPWDKIFIGLATIGLLGDPKRRWVRNPANLWMVLFLITIYISSAFATYPAISWSHWFDFFSSCAIYFLIINIVTTEERYFIFLGIFLLANLKLSYFGARTWAGRGFRFENWGIMGPSGPFQNSADLSIEMLMFLPVAFEVALFLKARAKAAAYWLLLLLPLTAMMTVLGASSRGAQVAMAGQIAHTAYQRKLKLKVLIMLALVGWATYAILPAKEKARFQTAGHDNTSIQRLDYWRAGIHMIEDHPVLGIGYYNFPQYYAIHDSKELWHGTAQLPHNIFIQVGTDTGLVGLGIFLILIYRNLKTARDIRRKSEHHGDSPTFAASVARGLATATWGFIIAGQFDTVAYYPFLWMNLALTVSLWNIVEHAPTHVSSTAVPDRQALRAPSAQEGRRKNLRRSTAGQIR